MCPIDATPPWQSHRCMFRWALSATSKRPVVPAPPQCVRCRGRGGGRCTQARAPTLAPPSLGLRPLIPCPAARVVVTPASSSGRRRVPGLCPTHIRLSRPPCLSLGRPLLLSLPMSPVGSSCVVGPPTSPLHHRGPRGCPLGTRHFSSFFPHGRPEVIGGRISLTDGCWPMPNRCHSPAGALRRFKCTGGRRFFLVFRTALRDPPFLSLSGQISSLAPRPPPRPATCPAHPRPFLECGDFLRRLCGPGDAEESGP